MLTHLNTSTTVYRKITFGGIFFFLFNVLFCVFRSIISYLIYIYKLLRFIKIFAYELNTNRLLFNLLNSIERLLHKSVVIRLCEYLSRNYFKYDEYVLLNEYCNIFNTVKLNKTICLQNNRVVREQNRKF